jgi:hypothetical protein
MAKLEPDVALHIYRDLNVTPQRVRAFASAPYEVRLLVLAELRKRVGDDTTNLEFSMFGFVLAFLALFISPVKGISGVGLPFLASLIIGAILGLAGVAFVLPFAIVPVIRQGKRERAVVWLGAYLDELPGRRSTTVVTAGRRRR